MTTTYDTLSDRTAVVTGAASGIGAATATVLARSGARVALLARRLDRLTELAATITADGGHAIPVQVDVIDPAAVARAVAHVHDAVGPADLVVNAAGVMLPNPVDAGRSDEWRRMIDTNLTGLLEVTRAFVPDLLAAADAGRPADLVNVSSIAAHIAFPTFGVYSATKAAVTQLSASLRTELGARGIRVTNIEPGLTATELGGHIDNADITEQLGALVATVGALSAEEVADLVGYVTSRAAHVNLRQVVVLPTRQA